MQPISWQLLNMVRPILMGSATVMRRLTPPPAPTMPAQMWIPRFPAVHQQHSLACEYAAAEAVTRYWGNVVTQDDFIREVPSSPNPHRGFRGAIDGPFGGVEDYGVYAEPLAPVLEHRDYQAQVYYGDLTRLKTLLNAQNPVVVWLTNGRGARAVYTSTYEGATFRLVPGEHAVVAYGYDNSGLAIMNVGNGNYYHADWASFLRRWGYFAQMMLVITPHGG